MQLKLDFDSILDQSIEVDYYHTRRPISEWNDENEIEFWVDDFAYNKHNCCVAGRLMPFAYYKHVFIEITLCKASRGWTYGCHYGSRFNHVGTSGGAHGNWYDARDQYPTQRQAAVSGAYDMIRWIDGDLKHAPAAAAKAFNAAKNALLEFIGGEREPVGV